MRAGINIPVDTPMDRRPAYMNLGGRPFRIARPVGVTINQRKEECH